MLPPDEALVGELPADKFNAAGRTTGDLRAEVYRRHDLRNAFNVVSIYLQSFGVIALALALHHPVGWIVAFIAAGRGTVLFAILMHESAHRLLFSNKRLNDLVGEWLLAAPVFVPLVAYRRSHMAHHKEEFGPNEPDIAFYRGYPITRESWHRKLRRDALGVSGWKNLKALFGALKSPTARPVVLRILLVQAIILAAFTLAGYPLAYFLLWLAPWMTVWRVLNRLRSVAEHGGLEASPDRRVTTHHIEQSLAARFWFVPFNTGWHLAHHVDSGVPFQNLPRLHRELVDCGWVTPDLGYRSYREFWKIATSRREQPVTAEAV